VPNSASLTVITWNISFSFGLAEAPGVRPWAERVDAIASYVRDADVFAVQEVSNRQLTDLRASLPGHECVAVTTPIPEAVMPAVRRRYGPNAESSVTEVALFLSRESFFVTGSRRIPMRLFRSDSAISFPASCCRSSPAIDRRDERC
jgi:hypothetical protein